MPTAACSDSMAKSTQNHRVLSRQWLKCFCVISLIVIVKSRSLPYCQQDLVTGMRPQSQSHANLSTAHLSGNGSAQALMLAVDGRRQDSAVDSCPALHKHWTRVSPEQTAGRAVLASSCTGRATLYEH